MPSCMRSRCISRRRAHHEVHSNGTRSFPGRPGAVDERRRTEHLHRHRRHRRRLLPAGRRHRGGAVQACARHAGDGRGHRRLGRQPEADRQRQALHRPRDGRRQPGRLSGRGQVQGQQGPAQDPDGAVPEPHARGQRRGPGHREDGGPEGQARLHRLARQRHRGHGVSPDRGRRPRQGQGHDSASASASPNRSMPSRTARSTRSSGSAACPPPR